MISEFCIRRPIFAAVISIVITLIGALAMFALPIARYPQIEPPNVQVQAFYPGASAATVAETVAAPIEVEINGVDGMQYMTSTSSSNGDMTLTDGIVMLELAFLGGRVAECRAACDFNGTGELDITTAVYLFSYPFIGGPKPPPPFESCGPVAPRG